MTTVANKCQECGKRVGTFKKIKLLDMVWHKKCCHCAMCDLQLSSKTARVVAGKTYCIRHCPKTQTKSCLLESLESLGNNIAKPEARFAGIWSPSILRNPSNDKAHRTETLTPLRETVYSDKLIQIETASICETVADAIVNSTSVTTDLSIGALSKAIAKAGGPAIQRDLDRRRKEAPKSPTFGDVVVTTGGNLKCDYIFHTILRHWKEGQHVVQDLRQLMKAIFNLANENECRSLAIPPIGTGGLGYPKHIVAQVLYAEAAEYLDNEPDSYLERIIFVVNGERGLSEIFKNLQFEEEQEEKEDEEDEDEYVNMPPKSVYEVIIPGIQTKADNYYESLDDHYTKSFRQPNSATPDRDSSLQTFPYPKNWNLTEHSDKPYEAVELNPMSEEYRKVLAVIVAADGEKYEKFIANIQRIENGRCYEVYEHLKRMMIKTNTIDVMNERYLFHGTSASAKDNIIATGFNRNYAGAKGIPLYGKGVYFALNFSYSAQPQYSPPERQFGLKHIFLCRVLTGMSCLGHRNLLDADYLHDGSRQYDSAVNDIGNPKIFVVFKDYVAYPEYLISFYEDSSDYANL